MPVYAYDVDPDVPEEPPINFAASPLLILYYDLVLIINQLYLLLLVLSPIPKPGVDLTISGILLQVVALLASIVVTLVLVASLLFGVPTPWMAIAFAYIVIQLIQIPQGDTVIPSEETPTSSEKAKFQDEAWFAVNGICTSSSGLRLIMANLQETFHRPITGLNNRTFGFFFDFLECLVQRDLFWPTQDLRTGYQALCGAILDDSKKRVVLIAHSQGGILAARWMDQLLADFPPSRLSKLEVYTFASAANHFSAPLTGSRDAPFSRVEHFANENDFVARIGVLAFTNRPANDKLAADPFVIPKVQARYAGRIFYRTGNTGHLLLSHYLRADNSILKDPFVREHSKLVEYIEGGFPSGRHP